MKYKIAKGVIEVILIAFSVLLAFYLEDLRQNANEKKELILKLKELKNSVAVDSIESENKYRLLIQLDSTIHSVLKQINNKNNAATILNSFRNTRFYSPLRNWTLERMLKSESFDKLSANLKKTLEPYDFDRNFAQEAVENQIYVSDQKIEGYLYEHLKYRFIGASAKLDYKIKDSTVLYSEILKSYLVKKSEDVIWIEYRLKETIQEAHEAIRQIDKELSGLQ